MKKRLSIYNAVTVLLIICTIPLGELTQFLPNYADEKFYPLFPLSSQKIQWAWYYFFVMRCVSWLLVMMAVVRIAQQTTPFVWRACKVYLFYRCADLAAFMLFRSEAPAYAFVYVAVAISAIYQYLQYLKDEKTINNW